jgi:hypothetical protein
MSWDDRIMARGGAEIEESLDGAFSENVKPSKHLLSSCCVPGAKGMAGAKNKNKNKCCAHMEDQKKKKDHGVSWWSGWGGGGG